MWLLIALSACSSCKKPFSYDTRTGPRVFAFHDPLVPGQGAALTVHVEPEAGFDPDAFAVAHILRQGSTTWEDVDCVQNGDGNWTCATTAGPSGEAFVYASLHLQPEGDGPIEQLARTQASWRLHVGDIAENSVVPLRVPVGSVRTGPQGTYDVVMIRDGSGYSELSALDDLADAIPRHALGDPPLRWRDGQVAFWYAERDGTTTSYDSGLSTRCGQDPWPTEGGLPAELAGSTDMDVLGVIHGKSGPASGIEGTASGGFRDCAATHVDAPGLPTFSAFGPRGDVFAHELGHAMFGLGDEYWEDDETRSVAPVTTPPEECCCCNMTDCASNPLGCAGGTAVGSAWCWEQGEYVSAGSTCTTGGGIVLPGQQVMSSCTNFQPPPECDADGDGGCPPIASGCVSALAFVSDLPLPDSPRPNVFGSFQDCDDALPLINAHPGVEAGSKGLGTCRQLCGPDYQQDGEARVCPCEPSSQAWIVDLEPGATSGDRMAGGDGDLRPWGGACAWCIETSLCVRWETARGQSAADAWAACAAP